MNKVESKKGGTNLQRKRARRGSGKREVEYVIYYNNINGFRSKGHSLKKILSKIQPDVFVLCETMVKDSMVIKKMFPEYSIVAKSKKDGQGGIVVASRKDRLIAVMDVTSTLNQNILNAKVRIGDKEVSIVAVHSPQETDLLDFREDFLTELNIEAKKAINDGANIILVGDMNAKMEKVEGSMVVSGNGKLLTEVIDEKLFGDSELLR